MEEHPARIRKVEGSNPFVSTRPASSPKLTKDALEEMEKTNPKKTGWDVNWKRKS